MRRGSRSAWVRRIGVGAAVVGTTAVCAVASQASPTGGGWSEASTLANAGASTGYIPTTVSGGAGIYTVDSNGNAAIATFSNGTLGPLTDVPAASDPTGSMALPGGSQLLTTYPNGAEEQFPDGSFAPTGQEVNGDTDPGAFAATTGEIVDLINSSGCGAIAVQTSTIAADGTITANGAPSTVFTPTGTNPDGTCANDVESADITLDPGGRTDVLAVIQPSDAGSAGDELIDFSRTAVGDGWTSSPVPGFSASSDLAAFASAPGGRAIAEFIAGTENSSGTDDYSFSYSIRDPGGSFGSVHALSGTAMNNGSGAFAAAGSDGTLALTYPVGADCASGGSGSIESAVFDSGSDVPAIYTAASNEAATETALGAGSDSAIVAMNVATGAGVCYSGPSPVPEADESDVAVIVGADAAPVETFGTQTNSQISYDLGITGAGIDTNGNAVVYGSLSSPGAYQYATYGSPGTPTPVTSSTTTSLSSTSTTTTMPTTTTTTTSLPTTTTTTAPTTTTTTTVTSAPTTTTTTTTSGSPTTSTAAPPPPGSSTTSSTTTAPPTQTRTSTAVSSTSTTAMTQTSTTVSSPPPPPPNPPGLDPTDTVAPTGTQNITISNGNSTAENIAANEIYVASGLATQIASVHSERARHAVHGIEVGRFSITIPAHSRRIAHLRLTRQALGLLRHHGRLRVTLTVITKIHGRTTSTIVRHLVLRAAPVRHDRDDHPRAGESQRESRQLSIALIDLRSRRGGWSWR